MLQTFGAAARILRHADRKPTILLAATQLGTLVFMPLELYTIKLLIDAIQQGISSETLRTLIEPAVWLAIIMLVNNIAFGSVGALSMTRLDEIGQYEQGRLILEKTVKLPLRQLESPDVTNLRSRAQLVSLYSIYDTGVKTVGLFAQVVMLSGIVISHSHWVLIPTIGMLILIQAYFHRRAAQGEGTVSRELAPQGNLLLYYIKLMTSSQTAKEIRLFGIGQFLHQRWLEQSRSNNLEKAKQTVNAESLKWVSGFIMALMQGLLPVSLLWFLWQNHGTAGDFTLLLQSAVLLFHAINSGVANYGNMQALTMKWDDFTAYLQLAETAGNIPSSAETTRAPDPYAETSSGTTEMDVPPFHLKVERVSYRYADADKLAVQDVTFDILAGQRVALVGENGSGKSTLVKLLSGLYPPTSGQLDWGSGKLPQFSAVFQDYTRMHLTIRENVALGGMEHFHSDDILLESLGKAAALEACSKLDQQLGTEFGGRALSGGEWQRLAMARAYLRAGQFIFFDEPTAALDPKAEQAAFAAFLQLTRGCSALLVTHRLGAARLADWILVMQEGRLVEQGTHEQLLALGGEYHRLYSLQASWYR